MTYYILLILSILLNIVAAFYIVYLLRNLFFISENIDDLKQSLYDFRDHLESLYALQTFYGDQTLKNLIIHSKDVCEDIAEFDSDFSLEHQEEAEETDEVEEIDEEKENLINENTKGS